MNIGNIHAMRDALGKLTALVHSTTTQEAEWGALVEGTKWLTAVRLLLNAAYRAAVVVQRQRMPVLLHCSHGWDRWVRATPYNTPPSRPNPSNCPTSDLLPPFPARSHTTGRRRWRPWRS
jgi:hypothetical protein